MGEREVKDSQETVVQLTGHKLEMRQAKNWMGGGVGGRGRGG